MKRYLLAALLMAAFSTPVVGQQTCAPCDYGSGIEATITVASTSQGWIYTGNLERQGGTIQTASLWRSWMGNDNWAPGCSVMTPVGASSYKSCATVPATAPCPEGYQGYMGAYAKTTGPNINGKYVNGGGRTEVFVSCVNEPGEDTRW